MMNYGVAQSRDQQMQIRKSATFKMAIVIAVLAFLGWLTGRLYFDVNTPVWILIAGSLFVLFLYYASVMSDMRKINDENIGYLLHYGKENQMLVDTINASLERNGCISRFDLKSIQYEIWAHNHDLKWGISFRLVRTMAIHALCDSTKDTDDPPRLIEF